MKEQNQRIQDIIDRLVDMDGEKVESRPVSVFNCPWAVVDKIEVGGVYRTRFNITALNASTTKGALCLTWPDGSDFIEESALIEVVWLGIDDPGWDDVMDCFVIFRRCPGGKDLYVAENCHPNLENIHPLEFLALQSTE